MTPTRRHRGLGMPGCEIAMSGLFLGPLTGLSNPEALVRTADGRMIMTMEEDNRNSQAVASQTNGCFLSSKVTTGHRLSFPDESALLGDE